MKLVVNSKTHGLVEFLVDPSFKAELDKYYWCVSKESKNSENTLVYAVGWKTPKAKNQASVRLHRLVAGAEKGQKVDHINGNTLDNRKENLRIVDHTVNMQNTRKRKNATSRHKGVCWSPQRNAWRARLYSHRVTKELGYFKNESDAAKAYNDALDKYGIASPKNTVDSAI